MMKPLFKTTFFSIALLSAAFVLPPLVYAEEGEPEANGVNFCASIETAAQKISQSIIDKENAYSAKEREWEEKRYGERADKEKTLYQARLDADVLHEKAFARLISLSKDPAEKEAILKFKSEVALATSARNESIDAALALFELQNKKLVALRQLGINNATTTFQTAIDRAQKIARANCRMGISGAISRAKYVRDLKAAKTELQANLQSITKNNNEILSTTKIRDNSIKKATETFKASVAASSKELRRVLSDNDE